LDGNKIRTYTGETPKEKMFILLGLYQGAFPSWAGETDPNMPYPRDFEIDYVRVCAPTGTTDAVEAKIGRATPFLERGQVSRPN
jgi:hypothetical protein